MFCSPFRFHAHIVLRLPPLTIPVPCVAFRYHLLLRIIVSLPVPHSTLGGPRYLSLTSPHAHTHPPVHDLLMAHPLHPRFTSDPFLFNVAFNHLGQNFCICTPIGCSSRFLFGTTHFAYPHPSLLGLMTTIIHPSSPHHPIHDSSLSHPPFSLVYIILPYIIVSVVERLWIFDAVI